MGSLEEALKKKIQEPFYHYSGDNKAPFTLIRLNKLSPPPHPTIFLVTQNEYEKAAVLLLSSADDPSYIYRSFEKADALKKSLGATLGRPIIKPIYQETFNEQSFALLPYCKPLSENKWIWYYQRYCLRPFLFKWLIESAKKTVAPVSSTEIENDFVNPLNYLLSFPNLPLPIVEMAKNSKNLLEKKLFIPCYTMMHCDLWKGNILISPSNKENSWWPHRFVIIDWMGSRKKGYPFYDMIRMAHSFKASTKYLQKHLLEHSQLLGCEVEDARTYLLAALGSIALNLGTFSPQNFINLACTTTNFLDRSLQTRNI